MLVSVELGGGVGVVPARSAVRGCGAVIGLPGLGLCYHMCGDPVTLRL